MKPTIKAYTGKKLIKSSKMKFSFKRWLKNWLDSDMYEEAINIGHVEETRLQSEGMKFQLYKANGGYVIETRKYNSKNDRNDVNLHIVTDEKDIGEELGKIITLEALR